MRYRRWHWWVASCVATGLCSSCSSTTSAGPPGSRDYDLTAQAAEVQAVAHTTEEFFVPAADACLEHYVRNKAPSDLRAFSAEKTVLFVHGATYPSEITFDLSVGGTSWMESIARAGYDVYLLDIRGYG